MDFYNKMAEYYDYIFPVSQDKASLLIEILNSSQSKSVLDVGCGTGGYTKLLSQKGFDSWGIDLSTKMIEIGLNKNIKDENDANLRILDMLEIPSLGRKFDLIFCIGNTLVHILDIDSTKKFLQSCYKSLNKGGSLLIQIVNYDWIMAEEITSLPTIERPEQNLVFTRDYKFLDKGLLQFETTIEIDKTKKETYKSETLLRPLFKDELEELLISCGFKTNYFYANFKKDKYEKSAKALVSHSLK